MLELFLYKENTHLWKLPQEDGTNEMLRSRIWQEYLDIESTLIMNGLACDRISSKKLRMESMEDFTMMRMLEPEMQSKDVLA